MALSNHQHINQDSGDYEYYTPQAIIELARLVMGAIDLDPASSLKANERVGACRILTVADNGLACAWAGRVWLNHPFGRVANPLWVNKLVSEYKAGRVEQFCCITFAATSEQWFQPLLNFPQCFLCPRTNYMLPDGTLKRGVTKGSVVTYGGSNVREFASLFGKMGKIKLEYSTLNTL